jgi:hypothetical protein
LTAVGKSSGPLAIEQLALLARVNTLDIPSPTSTAELDADRKNAIRKLDRVDMARISAGNFFHTTGAWFAKALSP